TVDCLSKPPVLPAQVCTCDVYCSHDSTPLDQGEITTDKEIHYGTLHLPGIVGYDRPTARTNRAHRRSWIRRRRRLDRPRIGVAFRAAADAGTPSAQVDRRHFGVRKEPDRPNAGAIGGISAA